MEQGRSETEKARRHVEAGREIVERQRRTLAELRADGHPIQEAEKLLATLEQTQRLHEEHLARLVGPASDGDQVVSAINHRSP